MSKCFISYSDSYRPVMEMIRHLVETIGFEVDVFDGPDLDRPAFTVFQQRVSSADCIVVILGPIKIGETEPAKWPAEEGVLAAGSYKPIALFIHPETRLPESLRNLQTPARFNFWDTNDQIRNIHHVVKHLLDLKRRVDLPPGTQPFLYTNAITRNRISRSGSLVVEVYSEVVARQECSRFHHALDTGLDNRNSSTVKLISEDAYEIEATLGFDRHSVFIEIEDSASKSIPYFVNVNPPLAPGENFGYRRVFEVENWLPLTQTDLRLIADEPGFPSEFKQNGKLYYGDVYDVFYEMDKITLAIHFPRRYSIRSHRALSISTTARTINVADTERINSPDTLRLETSPDSGERVLSLSLRRPLINHRYALLYEPE